jgi:hypothetical protein
MLPVEKLDLPSAQNLLRGNPIHEPLNALRLSGKKHGFAPRKASKRQLEVLSHRGRRDLEASRKVFHAHGTAILLGLVISREKLANALKGKSGGTAGGTKASIGCSHF